MYSRHELAAGFHALGIAPGETVMAHASVRAVGDVAGGPDQIHLALKDALTDAGTLMMYASCPAHYDEIGRGNLSPEQERELLEKLPAFDPLTARSQRENGALVELFRTYPGSKESTITWRVLSRGAGMLSTRTEAAVELRFRSRSRLSIGSSPLDGKILLLGCDHDTVTFLHYAEHIVDIPGKRVSKFKVPVSDGGICVWRDMEEFDTSDRRASELARPLLRAAR